MAVTSNLVGTTLGLRLNEGKDEKGKDIITIKKLDHVNILIKDEDLFAVAHGISGLLKYPVEQTQRINSSMLEEE